MPEIERLFGTSVNERLQRVHLTSAYPFSATGNFGSQWLIEHAAPLRGLELVDSADHADVIIFVENHPASDPYFWKIFSHPAYKKYPRKCVLYHDDDFSLTMVRTVSPSIERRNFNPKRHRPMHYVARLCANEVVDRCAVTPVDSWKYLYSFIGSVRTHLIRQQVMRLRRDDAFLLDTSGKNAWDMDAATRVKFQAQFAQVSAESAFVLCPRGIGPATYRLFESMQMGRVPVVIADEWVPPTSVNWPTCSIFVPEHKVSHIPEILAERAAEAAVMGKNARAEWERAFSPANSLQQIAQAAVELLKEKDSILHNVPMVMQLLRPYHLKRLARTVRGRLRA